MIPSSLFFFFFFNDTATTEIYTLSLHDALPILRTRPIKGTRPRRAEAMADEKSAYDLITSPKEIAELVMITDLERSEEHTSELQSHSDLVCRLLLEKKKRKPIYNYRRGR